MYFLVMNRVLSLIRQALYQGRTLVGDPEGHRPSKFIRGQGRMVQRVKESFVAWEAADVRAALSSGLRPPVSPACQ